MTKHLQKIQMECLEMKNIIQIKLSKNKEQIRTELVNKNRLLKILESPHYRLQRLKKQRGEKIQPKVPEANRVQEKVELTQTMVQNSPWLLTKNNFKSRNLRNIMQDK